MSVIILLVTFVLGSLIGLLLTEFLSRKINKDIFPAPLRCGSCKIDFRNMDRMPIYRFAVSKFRCRHCNSRLNWKYFFIEALCGLALSVSVFQIISGQYSIIQGMLLFLTLITLVEFLLLRNLKLLSEKTLLLSIPLFATSSIYISNSFYFPLMGGLIIGSFFAFQHVVSEDWIDYEEVLIGILSGIILGILPAFIAVVLTILITSIIAVYIAVVEKHKLHDEALLAEVLILVTFMVLAFRETALDWYFNII